MIKCKDFFKALSDETRISILKRLEKKPLCVSEIAQAFKVSQPTISHHLDILKRAGLVETKRKGQYIYYFLNPNWLKECCGDFLSMFECFSEFLKKHKIIKKSKKESKNG